MAFCQNVTLPPNFPSTGADLAQDYDVTKKTLTTSDATNIMTLVRQQARLNGTETDAIILDKIEKLTDDNIEIILSGCGFGIYSPDMKTAEFKSKITAFNNDVKNTYCVYQALYRNALNDLFSNLSVSISDEKKVRAVTIAKKILIILAGVHRTELYLRQKSNSLVSSITSKNIDIDTNTDALKNQINVLESKSADAELYKRMVEYTEEKNRAHRNLLSLYAVLNIVGLGLIFYIAKE